MSETLTIKFSRYSDIEGTVTNPEKAYDSDTTTYAQTDSTIPTGTVVPARSATANVISRVRYYLPANALSLLPAGAQIIGGTCSVKGRGNRIHNDSLMMTGSAQLNITDGDFSVHQSLSLTQLTDYDLSLTAEQTEALLSNDAYALLSSSCKMTNSSSKSVTIRSQNYIYARLYDIYITVEYEIPSGVTVKAKVSGEWVDGTIKAKVNGEWVDATALYIKSNGTWVQIE